MEAKVDRGGTSRNSKARFSSFPTLSNGGKEKSGDLSLSRAKVDGGGGALPSSLADAFLKGLISWGTLGTPPLLLRPIGRSSVVMAQVGAGDLLLPFGEKDGWI